MSSAIVILSFTIQVKSCHPVAKSYYWQHVYMYTNHTANVKKKLYPVRSDRHLYTSNLIISPCTTKSSHYFPLLFICQVLGKSTFILTNTHTT